jgi:formylglycine-generating enzyme required for sulfatase activity
MRWVLVAAVLLGLLGPFSGLSAEDRPIVAVFQIEDKSGKLGAQAVDQLTDYLGSLMARRGFKVVPRSQLKERLTEAKKGTYKECYEESCQIEIGKELAAQKSLSSQVLKIGKQCKVTVNLFDLKTAASDGAGAGSGDCDEDGVVKSLEEAIEDLMKTAPAPADKKPAIERSAAIAPVTGDMVRIPAGEFLMGCSKEDAEDSECKDDEKPPHKVWVSEFWMDTTEVTVTAYAKCVQAGSCRAPNSCGLCTWNVAGKEQHPVDNVDWLHAKAYCKWAGKRLPTEAEWEKAARGGTTGARYGELDAIAWYDKNSGGATHPVGVKQPNSFGLYDVFGNVGEWCSDWFGGAYTEAATRDPGGPGSGQYRIVRGGSWFSNAEYVRAAVRRGNYPGSGLVTIGFRCARSGS